ncbi:MAG TPA: hypothetical protein PKK06_15595 [Phycisphaerae bacterium]|nr:hypothetical protein [Phycisphaerae bacterium]HNU45961.1 hypothetical protein [Phycisphaerae bacterium]
MLASTWLETVSALLAVLAPLVGVPLTVITFYLRSLREAQVTWHGHLGHRLDAVEAAVSTLRGAVADVERNYTTKEEWLRESMQARRLLEQLSGAMVRVETTWEKGVRKDFRPTENHPDTISGDR